MLKAVQILGWSSGLTIISQRLTRTRNSSSISLKLSAFSSSSRRILSFNPTRMSSSLPGSDPLPKSQTFVSVQSSVRVSLYSNHHLFGKKKILSFWVLVFNGLMLFQGDVRKIKFCQWCGGPTKHEIPDGEEKLRAICTHCGKIAYQNPKMVRVLILRVSCLIK